LPRDAVVKAYGGPLTQGDLEKTPYEAFVAFVAEPRVGASVPHLGRFGEHIALVDCAVEMDEHVWQVELRWEALTSPARNYVVFVHLRDGERIVAQHDGEPATGHYPTSMWRSGDIVVDTHVLRVSESQEGKGQIVVGMYAWPEMERLAVAPAAGRLTSDELAVQCQMGNR
jgi:hypothetical protein